MKNKRSLSNSVNSVLQGTYPKPFGLYDFIIVYSSIMTYLFFTGLAIIFNRKIPNKWMKFIDTLNKNSLAESAKKTVLGEITPKAVKTKVEDISPTPKPTIL